MRSTDPLPQARVSHPEIPLELEPHELRSLTASQKIWHFREGIFRALEQAGRESRGQPPRIDTFREVTRLAEHLEAQGIRFGVSSTSIMNQRVRKILNEKAGSSNDHRKSRRKKITAEAVRHWLREARRLRGLNYWTKRYPYQD